jgi:TRAP-type C4-dicarboxylate transport system substrate-binding protein
VTDGVLSLALGVLPAKLYEVAPYITIANAGVVFSGGAAINRDTFDSLPEEVQNALLAAGKEYSRQHAADLVTRHQAVLDKMMEVGKTQDPPVTMTVLPQEERQKWIDNMPDIASEWVEANEAKGLPAREFMKTYLDALRAKGETPERAWDANL